MKKYLTLTNIKRAGLGAVLSGCLLLSGCAAYMTPFPPTPAPAPVYHSGYHHYNYHYHYHYHYHHQTHHKVSPARPKCMMTPSGRVCGRGGLL